MKKLLLGIITLIIMLSFLVYAGIQQVAKWFNENQIIFNQVIKVELKKPFEIKKREPIVKEVALTYPEEIDTPIEKYICDRFGPYQCINALAIAKSESSLREDAIGININSIDIGIFQINSIHFKKDGCSLKELVDPYKNIDCAFSIYSQQGNWSAWSVFNNGSFKNHL